MFRPFRAIYRLIEVVEKLKEEIHTMSTSIVTRDQFDAALQAGITTIISKIDDLAAKVAAGTVTTPEDFTSELTLLQSAVSEALAKDPDAVPTGDTPPAETPAS